MKWISSMVICMSLLLFACGGEDKSANTLTEEEQAEVQQLDSMANELDAVKNELRENTEALHSALEALD